MSLDTPDTPDDATELVLEHPADDDADVNASQADAPDDASEAVDEDDGAAASEQADDQQSEADNDEELLLDGAPLPAGDGKVAAPWIKNLRTRFADSQRELAKLRSAQGGQQAQAAEDPEPTLIDAQFDSEQYAKDMRAWATRQAGKAAAAAKAEAEMATQRQAYENRNRAYTTARASLKSADAQEAIDTAESTLSPIQLDIIRQYSSKPELLMLALGRNPALADELAAEQDHIRFARKAQELEQRVSTKTSAKPLSRPATKPEQPLPGNGRPGPSGATAVSNTRAEQLLAKAMKTGDLTEYNQYTRENSRQKARK
jgi:hypothetical protein